MPDIPNYPSGVQAQPGQGQPAAPSRRSVLKTIVYVAVLAAVVVFLGMVGLVFWAMSRVQSPMGQVPASLYRSSLPREADALAERWLATHVVKCGDNYIGDSNVGFQTVYAAKTMKLSIRNGTVSELDKLNHTGVEDRVMLHWGFSGFQRAASFKGGKRTSDWGLWGPGTLQTSWGLNLAKKNGTWIYENAFDVKRAQLPPLTCAALGENQ